VNISGVGRFLAGFHHFDALECAVGSEDILAFKLLLEGRFLYFGAESGSLALVSEVGSVDGVTVAVEGHIARIGPHRPAP